MINQILAPIIVFQSRYLPFDAVALSSGMLWGDTVLLPERLRVALKISGMQHVVSASGFNVGLALQLLQPLEKAPWPKEVSWLLMIFFVWFYVWLAGGSPSLIRAALMATGSLLCLLFGFIYQAKLVLVLLTAALLIVMPDIAHSISFQLSVAATWGIMNLLPLWQPGRTSWWLQAETMSFSDKKGPSIAQIIYDSLFVTIAAQAFTFPLLWYHFQEFSLVSFVANTFLLWLTPLITFLSLAHFMGALLAKQFGVWFLILFTNVPLSWLSRLFTNGVLFFGSWNSGLISLPHISFHFVLVWWVVLQLFIWYFQRKHAAS